jgi:RES domain
MAAHRRRIVIGRILFPIIILLGAGIKTLAKAKVRIQNRRQRQARKRSFLSESLSIRVARATGREGDHMIENAMTPNHSIDSLVIGLSKTKDVNWPWYVLRRPLAWVIIHELATSRKKGFSCVSFRARPFSGGTTPTKPCDFYRTESAWQKWLRSGWKPDRYNEAGERVIYFSTTAETAFREVRERNTTDPVYVQEFHLDLPDINSVTLGHDLERRAPNLNYLLLNSEYPQVGSRLENPYRATHFLSYACAVLGIDAIEYPSVKANLKSDPNEFNIVLFRRAVCSAEGMTVGVPLLHP